MLCLYETAEDDGYPIEWHAIKHLVREQAGNRCVRCKHPYRSGEHGRGEWSPCDEHCTHHGPLRLIAPDGQVIDEIDRLSQGFTAGDTVRIHAPDGVEARWRILTVQHLDGNKLNCRWWNLTALCQRDHLRIQGHVKMHRPYFLEHSEWMKPFAAGFYASTILGEELTREETMVRLDKLLSLGTSPAPHH